MKKLYSIKNKSSIISKSSKIKTVLLLAVLSIALDTTAAISITQSLVGNGPYYLTQADSTYKLTTNITTPGTAIVFNANNVTLDLNGYTITYGTVADSMRYGIALPPSTSSGMYVWSKSDITSYSQCSNAEIKNGTIIQGGKGNKCSPIIGWNENGVKIHHVTMRMQGNDTKGIHFFGMKDVYLYNNTITDSTKVVTDRHYGAIVAIDLRSTKDGAIEIYNNTIYNCVQFGIRVAHATAATVWSHIYGNSIYPNTIVANGYGVAAHGNKIAVFNNTITAVNGRGIHLTEDSSRVYSNTIDVMNEPVSTEFTMLPSHGIKLETCTNADIYNNNVISRGIWNQQSKQCKATPLSIHVEANSNNRIHNNTFNAIDMGGTYYNTTSNHGGAYCIELLYARNPSNLIIENNIFLTNHGSIHIWGWNNNPGDVDASAVKIRNNTFKRNTYSLQFYQEALYISNGANFHNLKFTDNAFENGIDFRNVLSTGNASKQWSVGYTGTASVWNISGTSPLQNIQVDAKDSLGNISTKTTNTNGIAYFELDDFSVTVQSGTKSVTEYNPYDFTAYLSPSVAKQQTIKSAGFNVHFGGNPTGGINHIESATSLNLYPNPASDNISISFEQDYTENIVIEITTLLGEILYEEHLNNFSGNYKKQLSLQGYANGIYNIQLRSKDRFVSKKIIVN